MSGTEAEGAVLDPHAIFARDHEPLRRYLVRLTGDGDAAADAAQEAFVRLLEQDPPPRDPRPWLFKVATNLVRDRARKTTRRRVLGRDGRAGDVRADPPQSPDQVVERETAREHLRQALDALSPKEKEALLMREEGFKHREIAEALGTTTGSVGTMLRRAIEKAADRLRAADTMTEEEGP